MVAPFAGCWFGGLLYDGFIYTGESPVNTPWLGLKYYIRPTSRSKHEGTGGSGWRLKASLFERELWG